MNCPVGYEGESTREDVGNTIGVSNTNTCIHTGGTNTYYISYAESTIATIISHMASPQECVGVTNNPGVPGRVRIMGFARITGVSHLTAVTGAVRQSDRI